MDNHTQKEPARSPLVEEFRKGRYRVTMPDDEDQISEVKSDVIALTEQGFTDAGVTYDGCRWKEQTLHGGARKYKYQVFVDCIGWKTAAVLLVEPRKG